MFAGMFVLALLVGGVMVMLWSAQNSLSAVEGTTEAGRIRGLKTRAVSCQILAAHGISLDGQPACDDPEVMPYYPGARLPAPVSQ
jgi:hypothetical protein